MFFFFYCVFITDPTPRFAHPSPTMGGELVITGFGLLPKMQAR